MFYASLLYQLFIQESRARNVKEPGFFSRTLLQFCDYMCHTWILSGHNSICRCCRKLRRKTISVYSISIRLMVWISFMLSVVIAVCFVAYLLSIYMHTGRKWLQNLIFIWGKTVNDCICNAYVDLPGFDCRISLIVYGVLTVILKRT